MVFVVWGGFSIDGHGNSHLGTKQQFHLGTRYRCRHFVDDDIGYRANAGIGILAGATRSVWPVTVQFNFNAIIAKTKIIQAKLKQKIYEVCDKKIAQKGADVGLSFYAFFANKNDDPALLMEAAVWWIETHQLDHFEKAIKIKRMIEAMA